MCKYFKRIIIFLFLFNNNVFAQFGGGKGTVEEPYMIVTVAHLQKLATEVNEGNNYIGQYFVLESDLDLSSVCGKNNGNWMPIGRYKKWSDSESFSGFFDGKNHVVRNLYIHSSKDDDYQGLFGSVNGAHIENLILKDVDISAQNYVGGICGCASLSSKISSCYVSGKIAGIKGVGGICGFLYTKSELKNCVNASKIDGSQITGGVCGMAEEAVQVVSCDNRGLINGDNLYTGGVCGFLNAESFISECTNYGEVHSKSLYSGGICGYVTKQSTVNVSVNTGFVFSSDDYAGGVCGYVNNSLVDNCLNSGYVTGKAYCAGGVCGYAGNFSTVSYNLNQGNVYGGVYAGGVCGFSGKINLEHCYYDQQMCAVTTSVGLAKDSVQAEGLHTQKITGNALKKEFGTAYWIYEDGAYPRLEAFDKKDVSLIASCPIYLSEDETVQSIKRQFSVNTEHDVVWTSKQHAVYIANGQSSFISKGVDTLIAMRNGVEYKQIPVMIEGEIPRFIMETNFSMGGDKDTLLHVRKNLPLGNWSTSNINVIKIDKDGRLYAQSVGQSTCYYTLPNKKKDSVTVQITYMPKLDTIKVYTVKDTAVAISDSLLFHFDYASAFLRLDKHQSFLLDSLVHIINHHLDLRLLAVGHTCDMGSDRTNERLGMKRAEAIKKALQQRGVAPERIRVLSRADKEPIEENDTNAHRQENRRVRIYIE